MLRIRILALGAALVVALTLPAAGSAAAPTQADRLKARSSCADERGLTRARHNKFSLKYGVSRHNRRAFARCVTIKARRFAGRRGAAPPAVPGLPQLPEVPGLPGIPELPGVRLQCQMEQMEDPIGFAQEYPGPNPTDICVMMESMP
jgi:hypothetical protein